MDYKMGSVVGQDSFLDSLIFAFDSLNINSFDFANSSYKELISGVSATPGGTILTTGSGLSYAYSSNVGSASGSTYLNWTSIIPDFTSYTFEAWIKPQFTTTGAKTIWSRFTTTGGSRGLSFVIIPNGGTPNPNTFYINQGNGTATTQNYSDTITWSQNGWQQIVVSLSSSDNIAYFYFNGAGVGTRQVTQSVTFAAGTNIRVGVAANATTFGYDGGIGLIKIWNRKFTDSEIKFLYNSSRGRYGL